MTWRKAGQYAFNAGRDMLNKPKHQKGTMVKLGCSLAEGSAISKNIRTSTSLASTIWGRKSYRGFSTIGGAAAAATPEQAAR